MEGILAGADQGEKVSRGPRDHRILAELPELEVVELRFGPDFEGVEPHSHSDHVDSFYVLEGEVEFLMDGETLLLGPGSFVAAPPGVEHTFTSGPARSRLLNVHAPSAGFHDWLRGLDRLN
jgi:quercetin dioxygenase-like cupin family protein